MWTRVITVVGGLGDDAASRRRGRGAGGYASRDAPSGRRDDWHDGDALGAAVGPGAIEWERGRRSCRRGGAPGGAAARKRPLGRASDHPNVCARGGWAE